MQNRRRRHVDNGIRVACDIYHRLARPVELAIVSVAFSLEEILKDFPQIVVVRCFEEIQSPHVAQVCRELLGMIFT